MTKLELKSLIQSVDMGGTAPATFFSRFHPNVILKAIESSYNDMTVVVITQAWANGTINNFDSLLKSYYYVPAKDELRQQYYVQEATGQDFNKIFVRSVFPTGQPINAFVPVGADSDAVMSLLQGPQIDPRCGYMVEDSRIFFDQKFNPQIPNITVKLIPTFAELADTDQINMPIQPLIEAAKNILINRPPKEDSNSGTTKTA